MVYLIGLLVMLMIAAPIVAILPNAEQKAQMKKRKLAMAANVRVELTHIDDPDPDPAKYISNTGKPLDRRLSVKAYRLVRRGSTQLREKPHNNWIFLRRSSETSTSRNLPLIPGWQCEGMPESGFSKQWQDFFEDHLPQLPDDVVRIEENNFVVSVYWQERGDVKDLLVFLSTCVNLTLGN